MTNTNPETGIRYGCVYLNSLDPDTAQWLWDDAENLSEEEAYAELKSEIERDAENIEEEVRIAIAERDYAMLSNDRYMEDEVEAAYNRLGYDDRDDYIDTRLEIESQTSRSKNPRLREPATASATKSLGLAGRRCSGFSSRPSFPKPGCARPAARMQFR